MNNLLTIEILRHKRGGHDDLLFELKGLVGTKVFDTYYFALAQKKLSVSHALALLLRSWKHKLSTMVTGDIVYLPIDFSDQSTGCIQVEKQEALVLHYGFSMREGYSINVIDPADFYEGVADFSATSRSPIYVEQGVLEKDLDVIINKLEN